MSLYSFFESLVDPLEEAPVVRPPDRVGAFYAHFLRPLTWPIALTVLASVLVGTLDLMLFVFVGWIVDWLSVDGPGDVLAERWPALAVMAALVLVGRPLAVLLHRGMTNLALVPGLSNMVRWRNHRYVLRQSLGFFQNDFAGRVAQKVTQTGPRLRETVTSLIDGVLYLLIFLVGTTALFAGLDWRLAAVVAGWTAGYALIVRYLVPPVRAKSAHLSEMTSMLSGRIVDSYTNIVSVKLFAHSGHEEAFGQEGFARQTRAFRDLMRAIVSLTLVLTFANGILIAGVAAVALWLWNDGAITVGSVALALGLVLRINQMSGWMLRTITSLFEDFGTVENGIETISQPLRVTDVRDASTLRVDRGEVAFQSVSFAYGGEAGIVVRDFDLTIAPGEKVGLVGRSGAGKSTLVNLLLRMHDIEAGRILVDGQDIAGVTQESLRRQVGVVTQDTSLLHRSVRDNIAYGKPEATEEDVREAARRARALEFVEGLTDPKGRKGFKAFVGERGVKLSGGQRQRIAIARVILKDAPILALDEATSALDSEVEAAIQDNLRLLMEGKTVIAIAHRLSTIAALDRLVVMDEGRILEEGTHDDLLARGGLYADLWARQSGGFIGGSAETRGKAA